MTLPELPVDDARYYLNGAREIFRIEAEQGRPWAYDDARYSLHGRNALPPSTRSADADLIQSLAAHPFLDWIDKSAAFRVVLDKLSRQVNQISDCGPRIHEQFLVGSLTLLVSYCDGMDLSDETGLTLSDYVVTKSRKERVLRKSWELVRELERLPPITPSYVQGVLIEDLSRFLKEFEEYGSGLVRISHQIMEKAALLWHNS
ncbi:MAG: hypothetical protein ACR2RB_04065 [Gammaproteobacteria bacterium]